MLFVLLGTVLLFLALNRLHRYVNARSSLPYPPGPPGGFIIGNLRHMPSKYPWLVFTEWARKYGPINYINVAGGPILIINTQEAALDLLEKRSAIYSDRPRFVMACELGGLDRLVGLMSDGLEHRRQRKLLAQALHPLVVARDYVPIHERFVHQLAKLLLNDSDNFLGHFDLPLRMEKMMTWISWHLEGRTRSIYIR
ncbi:cytochrome P450 1B1 [Tulasnella sp. JGI-2019a]|nr:cytochrome P450 1B1 [Tulasnella sp. JGI-2019a]